MHGEPWVCDCSCHQWPGSIHCMPCCSTCRICGKKIVIGAMEIHCEEAHLIEQLPDLDDPDDDPYEMIILGYN